MRYDPASVDDRTFAVPAFNFEQATLERILDFLAARRSVAAAHDAVLGVGRAPSIGKDDRIEPFQLQLICQRAEEIVQIAKNGAGATGPRQITMEDLGGDRGLQRIIRNFFVRQIDKLPGWDVRHRARRLCGDILISPTGRRLSIEQGEIERKTKLTRDQLDVLVNARLLRVDQRADSAYFELSHDTLVPAIRASRVVRRSASAAGHLTKGLVSVVAGLALLLWGFALGLVFSAFFSLVGALGAIAWMAATAFCFRVAWKSLWRACSLPLIDSLFAENVSIATISVVLLTVEMTGARRRLRECLTCHDAKSAEPSASIEVSTRQFTRRADRSTYASPNAAGPPGGGVAAAIHTHAALSWCGRNTLPFTTTGGMNFVRLPRRSCDAT